MREHGSGRRSAAFAIGAAAGALVVAASATLYISARIARTVVTPPRKRIQDQRILAVDIARGEVTFADTPDARVAGRYGLWFSHESGYARVGDVIRRDRGSVTRGIDAVVFGDLQSAKRGRLAGWYYLGPEELGYPVGSAAVETSLGQAPAWVIAPQKDTGKWVIQVHGRGANRHEGLRAVRVFREAGFTSLLISYRNDGDAPASVDRRYALGGTEWLDVEAGIRYATEMGATSIVLMGWSMGGAIVLQTITKSAELAQVDGIVLESPVIDWIDTLRFQAELYRMPSLVAQGAIEVLGARWSGPITGQAAAIDFMSMDFVARAGELTLPTLILHSDDDGFVPSTGSRALAASRPDIVTFVPFSEARHTKLWNYDEQRWTEAIKGWLGRLS